MRVIGKVMALEDIGQEVANGWGDIPEVLAVCVEIDGSTANIYLIAAEEDMRSSLIGPIIHRQIELQNQFRFVDLDFRIITRYDDKPLDQVIGIKPSWVRATA